MELEDSSLAEPPILVKTDTIGVWPEATVFPGCKNNFVPQDLNVVPNKLPIEFVNPDVDKF